MFGTILLGILSVTTIFVWCKQFGKLQEAEHRLKLEIKSAEQYAAKWQASQVSRADAENCLAAIDEVVRSRKPAPKKVAIVTLMLRAFDKKSAGRK